MRSAEVEVVRLRPKGRDLDEAALVAARAFQFDPFFEFLSPGPLLRSRGLVLYWRAVIAALDEEDRLLGARLDSGRLVGVAAWVRPGGYPPPMGVQLRQGLGALRALVPRPLALVQGSRYLLAIERAHPREPLWYLELLVVDPSVQRSGIGARLQTDVMAVADESGLDCYLETQNSDNLPYYTRFGYGVVDLLRPVRTGPPLWTMRRPPVAG